jgi:hypothetical protein
MFRDEVDPIYLGLEITSHRVFKELARRAESGRRTFFLVPRRRDLPGERWRHYDEVRAEWLKFLKEGPQYLRENIRIQLTWRALPELFTSAIAKRTVRLDVYQYGDTTTRRGEMIQAPVGSSLYDLVYQRFAETADGSPPLFAVWPLDWAYFFWKRVWLTVLGLGIGGLLTWVGSGLAAFLAAIALGIAGNALYEQLKGVRWSPPQLFER